MTLAISLIFGALFGWCVWRLWGAGDLWPR